MTATVDSQSGSTGDHNPFQMATRKNWKTTCVVFLPIVKTRKGYEYQYHRSAKHGEFDYKGSFNSEDWANVKEMTKLHSREYLGVMYYTTVILVSNGSKTHPEIKWRNMCLVFLWNYYGNQYVHVAFVLKFRWIFETATEICMDGMYCRLWKCIHSVWCLCYQYCLVLVLSVLSWNLVIFSQCRGWITSNIPTYLYYFPRCWPFVRGIHWSPVDSPNKGQWRRALMFSLIYAWTNGWANNRGAGDLRPIALIMTSLTSSLHLVMWYPCLSQMYLSNVMHQ